MCITSKCIVMGIFVAPVLAGCSTFPIPDDVTRKSTYDIVEQIRCEAKRAVVDYGQQLKNAAIAYEFQFHITETNDSSASATGSIPFVNGGSFGLGANAGLSLTRDTMRDFKVVDSFEQLRKTNCSREFLEKNWVYPIAGDIGVYEVVATFIKLQETDNPSDKEVFSFADTLTFTTDLSGGVSPTLTLLPITGKFRVTGASANLTAGRTDIHEVTLTLAPEMQTLQTVTAPTTSSSNGTTGSAARGEATATMARAGATRTTPRAGTTIRRFTAAGPYSSVLSATVIQSNANAKDRALLELDRQRILALQARTQNLLVGP
jgi:hypothetical protein